MEPYTVGSYIHVVKRGARGMPITRDEKDKIRFLRLLYHMNDEFKDDLWERSTAESTLFERPPQWPERRPLVRVLAWTLMPNHFHLLLQETKEKGMSKFLQKLCGSMSSHFNLKYTERGSIFQGAYRSRTVQEDRYLRWLASYIMVKNVLELFPGGLRAAANDFEKAWEWGVRYPFSSLGSFVNGEGSPVLEKEILGELYGEGKEFKSSAKEMILSRTWDKEDGLKALMME